MKKNGGIITQWQFHTVGSSLEDIAKVRQYHPTFDMEAAYIMTGTVVEDPTGRWQPGYHMRSSLVLKYCTDSQTVETASTIYSVTDDVGDPTFGCKDIGVDVMRVFY